MSNYINGESYTQESINGVTYTVINNIPEQSTYTLPISGSMLSDGILVSTGYFKINGVNRIQSPSYARYCELPVSKYSRGWERHPADVLAFDEETTVYMQINTSSLVVSIVVEVE